MLEKSVMGAISYLLMETNGLR